MNRLYKHEDVVQMLVDVIEQIEENEGIEIVDRPMGWESVRDYAEEVVSDIPSAENKGEWIPCSERLPEKNGFYLVTADHEHDRELRSADIYAFADGDWFTIHDDIVAWMPLPKPWEGADNE